MAFCSVSGRPEEFCSVAFCSVSGRPEEFCSVAFCPVSGRPAAPCSAVSRSPAGRDVASGSADAGPHDDGVAPRLPERAACTVSGRSASDAAVLPDISASGVDAAVRGHLAGFSRMQTGGVPSSASHSASASGSPNSCRVRATKAAGSATGVIRPGPSSTAGPSAGGTGGVPALPPRLLRAACGFVSLCFRERFMKGSVCEGRLSARLRARAVRPESAGHLPLRGLRSGSVVARGAGRRTYRFALRRASSRA